MDGLVGDELEAARPGQFNGVMLVGGRHIDALQGGNSLIQTSEYLIAGFSQPQNIAAVKILATGWVNDRFAGTHDGIYGAPQQSIQIDTSAGTAGGGASVHLDEDGASHPVRRAFVCDPGHADPEPRL